MDLSPITPIKISSISAGALLGTAGTAQLVQSINDSLVGSSFFGSAQDSFRDIRTSFLDNIVRPLQQAAHAVSNVVTTLMNPDVFRPLTDNEHFRTIPPCMYEGIVLYPPIRSLLEQGRISGFGYDPENLPKEDVWGRLIQNGTCEDVAANMTPEGEFWMDSEFRSTDPNVNDEELDAMEITRRTIDRLLKHTLIDPTDYPEDRG